MRAPLDPEELFDRGWKLYEGVQVAQDLAESARLFRSAAEMGSVQAQHNIAWMHENGSGVSQDPVEAIRWYRIAAERGYADAQNNLGLMYANGRGIAEDASEAVRWYRMAAEQGNPNGQCNLGMAYANGVGVPEDAAMAERWCRLAAEQGNVQAQTYLARWDAENGEGRRSGRSGDGQSEFQKSAVWYANKLGHVTTRLPPLESVRDLSQSANDSYTPDRKVSRNSPCPCGSGSKYKHCHGQL